MVVYILCLIIMFLFNLIKLVEVKVKDLIEWMDGKVLVGIGIFVVDVEYNGVIY